MAKAPKMGRQSIFRGKEDGVRVQGVITKLGGKAFERHREELRMLCLSVLGHEPKTVSDADVVEYLARGEKATRDEIERYIGR